MPLLTVDNLERIFGDSTQSVFALRGVSFAADRDEFIALKGPSGCGKSTLLHLIGAMDRATRGTVILDGMRLDLLGEQDLVRVRRQFLGFVFQFFNLLPTLTVLENVTLPMLLDGASERESRTRGLALLGRVGIGSPIRFSGIGSLSSSMMDQISCFSGFEGLMTPWIRTPLAQ